VVQRIAQVPGVEGVSPFVESEMMMSSSISYAGIVVRGIEWERAAHTSRLASTIKSGELAWLDRPNEARRRPMRFAPSTLLPGEGSAEGSGVDYERLQREASAAIERLEKANRDIERLRQKVNAATGVTGSGDPDEGSGMPALPGLAEGSGMPALPGLAEGSGMPALPGLAEGSGMPALPVRDLADRPAAGLLEYPGCVLGTELADMLAVDVGSVVNIIDPEGDVGPTGFIPRSRPFRVVALFYTGLYEYDSKLVFTRLDVGRGLMRLPAGSVTGVEVRGADLDRSTELRDAVTASLAATGASGLEARDWKELNRNLFGALKLEKLVMYCVLSIIIIVASFAIVCVLMMIVIEKRREIAIVKSMGATGRSIGRIFWYEGAIIGGLGTLIGLAVGLGGVIYLLEVGFPLDPNVYYIDRLPVDVDPIEVLAVVLVAFPLSLLATIYPSVQAAALDPISGLRND
jgi:lipoprotein-releasing system permease protein